MKLRDLEAILEKIKTNAALADCAISEDTKREMEYYMDTRFIALADKALKMIQNERRLRMKRRSMRT